MGYYRALVTAIPQCSYKQFPAIYCYISPVLLMRNTLVRSKHSLYISSNARRPKSQYSIPREIQTCHSLPSIMQIQPLPRYCFPHFFLLLRHTRKIGLNTLLVHNRGNDFLPIQTEANLERMTVGNVGNGGTLDYEQQSSISRVTKRQRQRSVKVSA
jgi:hypothetical protein